MADQELDNEAVITVKSSSSGVRAEIVRELYDEDLKRPSELIDTVRERTGTSEGNFYESLKTLQQSGIVEKMEGEKRATLYSLTDLGERVAEHLGLDEEEVEAKEAEKQEPVEPGEITIDDHDLSGSRGPGRREAAASKMDTEQDEEVDEPTEKTFETPYSLSIPEGDKEERVNQLARELQSLIIRSNVSLPEVEAAVERLKREFES